MGGCGDFDAVQSDVWLENNHYQAHEGQALQNNLSVGIARESPNYIGTTEDTDQQKRAIPVK